MTLLRRCAPCCAPRYHGFTTEPGCDDHLKSTAWSACSLFAKAFASLVIPDALKDKDRQERSVREQLAHWIIVRPGGLVDGVGKGAWTARPDACGFYPTITREDVAHFLVDECIATGKSSRWYQQSVALVS